MVWSGGGNDCARASAIRDGVDEGISLAWAGIPLCCPVLLQVPRLAPTVRFPVVGLEMRSGRLRWSTCRTVQE